MSCKFCPPPQRPQAYMTKELYQRILTQLPGIVERLHFHLLGEPLLHNELEFFLDFADFLGLPVFLVTNGLLLGRLPFDLLSKPALHQLSISLHSFPEIKSTNELNQYLDTIIAMTHRVNRKQLRIYFKLWDMGVQGAHTPYVLDRLRDQFSINIEQNMRSPHGVGIHLNANVYLSLAEQFHWPSTETGIPTNGFCRGLRDQFGILVDGTVVPCCLDANGAINLGNVNQHMLSEILQSPKAIEFYQGFSSRRPSELLCRHCTYKHRFT